MHEDERPRAVRIFPAQDFDREAEYVRRRATPRLRYDEPAALRLTLAVELCFSRSAHVNPGILRV